MAQKTLTRHFRRGPDGWGWTGDTAEAAAEDIAAPVVDVADYDALRKAELVELAEQQGIDSSGTKADIIERLGS